jgi:pyruvate formate lyase activating enzyme
MKVLTGGITELSTVDYPRHVASVLYLCGCSYRCPFCHNSALLEGRGCKKVEAEEIVGRMLDNHPLVSGVCITGGEPTLQQEGVMEICRGLKKGGMKVKLDTNGYEPGMIKELSNLVDYIAMDIKAPLEPEKYARATGRRDGERVLKRVKDTLDILTKDGVEFEARTTVVPMLSYEKDDLVSIAKSLRDYGVDTYVLQQFRPEGGCLDEEYENYASPPREYLLDLAREVKKYVPHVLIRTKENGEERV